MSLARAAFLLSALRPLTREDIAKLSRRADRMERMEARVDAAILGCELIMQEPSK